MKKEKDFYQVSLKLLLRNNTDELLVLKASDIGSYAGYYDLPGGRIDTDEFKTDFPKIVKREISEEIGDIEFQLSSKPVALGRHSLPASSNGVAKDIHILYIFFEAHYKTGKLNISDEHTGYKWLDLNKIVPETYFKSGILQGILMYLDYISEDVI